MHTLGLLSAFIGNLMPTLLGPEARSIDRSIRQATVISKHLQARRDSLREAGRRG